MERLKGLAKNDVITLEITGYTSEGGGVGHHNGQAVFVSGAAQGDVVECVIIKAKPNYAVGKLLNVLKASPDRIRPDCPAFPRCGGCVFRHISYEAELRLKQQRVKDAFTRIGRFSVPVSPIRGAEQQDRYRNKAQYPVAMLNGRLLAGFYAPFSHRVIDCKNCLLQPAEFSEILRVIAKWAEKYKIPVYDENTEKGLLRHIYLRRGFATGEIMVCLVINGSGVYQTDALVNALLVSDKNIKTILLNINIENTNVILGKKNKLLYGGGYIEDVLCGRRFRLSPLSFYQVNRAQAEKLYAQAAEFALSDSPKTLLDFYCGTGTIGLTMADKVKTLIGVEIVPDAVNDAKINTENNGIANAEFICADAAKAAAELEKRGIKPDVILLDPPRKGCDPSVLETAAKMNPQKIVYISCDPATLARDCALLKEKSYEVTEIVPFDLFPRTAHVETVVLMTKK